MAKGNSRDFQAELLLLLGNSNRAQRRESYQKAIDLNDCYYAKQRMPH